MVSENDILIEKTLKDGTVKKLIMRRFTEADAHRVFMAWNNPQSYRYNSIDWEERSIRYIANRPWPSDHGLYFMVLEDVKTHELLATCRFGRYWNSKEEDKVWDFGYSTFRSDDKEEYTIEEVKSAFKDGIKPDSLCWGKGYSSIMVEEIIKIAQSEGIKQIRSGADGVNLASQKVIMKNGLKFLDMDKDGDVDFYHNFYDENGNFVPLIKPTKEQLEPVWEEHKSKIEAKRNRFFMRMIIKKANLDQYARSLFFFLMTKASKIDEFQLNSTPNEGKIHNLILEIKETYKSYTRQEKKLVVKILKNYLLRWTKRIGNEEFEQSEVAFNLRCCNMVKEIISKKLITECEV